MPAGKGKWAIWGHGISGGRRGPKERPKVTENPHPTPKGWEHREAEPRVHGAMLWGGENRG